MSLGNLAYMCSHFQNASRVGLPMISFTYTKLHLGVLLGLYRNGLINSVTIGTKMGPNMQPAEIEAYDPEKVALRRLWVSLKYKDGNPVISKAAIVSRPSKRVTMKFEELKHIAGGRGIRKVAALQPGEILLLRTDKGVLECREAIAIRRGGEIICRFGL
ncbi:ribosomal protein S8 [Lipomyces oligophaga]|uniref:ribosomal protein S8 n=1 Tax=Lipomyces oligophaga TaxID=45792 RepID=UPI0034CDEADC